MLRAGSLDLLDLNAGLQTKTKGPDESEPDPVMVLVDLAIELLH